ncbi:cysteine desulfurase [Lottiidibacillus patelloidae]|uniref:cysteine desulfurase n=1 Tax=Lottiidibacillus patelloidae TaxID=2670334 RepID=A0A263BS94_9BACI|nr:aminotransferase class V-fold PLP-dependent enzyme [Lottiidibacillus patelloidae]OZM56574.1 cysteine desulfurase [Lottiidibacillus patelloidae]
MIYFDQAASTFPKPKSVIEAITHTLTNYSANPGRGNHKYARQTAAVIDEARKKVANFFGMKEVEKVIFYANATMALNQAIKGFPFQQGDHVVATSYEHNAVRRPLEYMKKENGITITYVSPNESGLISEKEIKKAINHRTKCIVVTHGSNVTGAITPLKKISELAKRNNLVLIVDASQTAGVLPIDVNEMKIDFLAFTGHKGLLGPQGTGGLLINSDISLTPLIHGGTGNFAELDDQPSILPKRYESGTLNSAGIAGLSAGIRYVDEKGLVNIFEHEWNLTEYCLKKLSNIKDIEIYGPPIEEIRLAVIPFTLNGVDSQEIAIILDQHYNIAVRAGKQCAPLTHEAIGTASSGVVRVSFGISNTIEEIDTFIEAIIEIRDGLLT